MTEIRSFLDLAGYYQKFVEGFSKLATPLSKLTRKEEMFVWSKACQKSFDELKRKMDLSPSSYTSIRARWIYSVF